MSRYFMDVLKIALGVFIGGLLAALAYTKIIAMGVERSTSTATASIQRELKKMGIEVDQPPREPAPSFQISSPPTVERLAHTHSQKAESDIEIAKQATLKHQERMREAWKKLYQPSDICRLDSSAMPCVNAHAAAHKRFMDLYGEMPPRF